MSYFIFCEFNNKKREDSSTNNTGLFFFKRNTGSHFAICNAGGSFAYVNMMHDSFSHAFELSKKWYNAFELIYRLNANLAVINLSIAIRFIYEHAKELNMDTPCNSLWGKSAGARMAAYL